jgi:hypothetical protein
MPSPGGGRHCTATSAVRHCPFGTEYAGERVRLNRVANPHGAARRRPKWEGGAEGQPVVGRANAPPDRALTSVDGCAESLQAPFCRV